MLGEQLITRLTDAATALTGSTSLALVGLLVLFLAGFVGASGLRYVRRSQMAAAPGPNEIDEWLEKQDN